MHLGGKMENIDINAKWRRISGLFRAADTFLFGLVPGEQNAAYRYLKVEQNFCDEYGRQYRGSYNNVLDEILKNQGIERLVYEVIIPLVQNEFGDPLPNGKSSLEILRDEYWDKGKLPDKQAIESYGIEWHSHKVYRNKYNPKEKYGKEGTGNCNLLNVTEVGDKWVVRFSEFCKLWYTELAELYPVSDQIAIENKNLVDNLKIQGNVTPTKLSGPVVELTDRFFKVLEALPYDLSGEGHQKMITKILTLTSLSKLPETKPVYDQLSNIIDFGRMIALVTIGEGNSRIGESKNE
jgi:hypothetical protein